MTRTTLAVAALCLLQFVDVLGVTVVVSALPSMLADVGAPTSAGGLVVTGYAAVFGGLLMFGARLGDRYGHRRVILGSLVLLAAGSLLGASARSVAVLAAARGVQGAAAAAAVPAALRLLTTVTPSGPARARALAAWSATGAAAGASGLVVGGVVTDLTSWRWLFLAYVPLTGLLAAAIGRTVPADVRDSGQPAGLDAGGAAALTAAVMSLIVGTALITEPGRRPVGIAGLATAVVLVGVVVVAERHAAAPLLPPPALRLPTLRRGALAAFLNTATTSSVITLATLYLQEVRHRSPLGAAAELVPFSLAVIAGSAGSARLLRRHPHHHVAALGLAVIAVCTGGLAATTALPVLLPFWVAGSGAGIGLSSVAATAVGTDVLTRWRGAAAGLLNTTAQLGSALGTATLLLVASATGGVAGRAGAGPVTPWATAAILAAIGATAVGARPVRPQPAGNRSVPEDAAPDRGRASTRRRRHPADTAR